MDNQTEANAPKTRAINLSMDDELKGTQQAADAKEPVRARLSIDDKTGEYCLRFAGKQSFARHLRASVNAKGAVNKYVTVTTAAPGERGTMNPLVLEGEDGRQVIYEFGAITLNLNGLRLAK